MKFISPLIFFFTTATVGVAQVLWVTGAGGYGEMGLGTLPPPTRIITPRELASGVSAVSAGGSHTLYLKTDGTVWATGLNTSGQLGDGTTTDRSTPVQVASGVAAVSGGYIHSLYLKTDGTVWATGRNSSGQLGNGTTTDRSTPVQVASGVAVAAGAYHSLYLKTDGTLWATGLNQEGQLGNGTTTNRSTAVQVASGVAAVAAGGYHSLYLKTDGTLWAMGNNYYGMLGDGTMTNRSTAVQVASGVASADGSNDHSVYLKTDGTVWAMGLNTSGQLGDGTTEERRTPVQVTNGVSAVSAGGFHTLYLKTDGTVWATGLNTSGQLGDGTTTDPSTPVQVQVASGVVAISAGDAHSLLLSLAAASTPAFGSTTRTTDGFTVQISNHDTNYTWAGTATASGTVVVSGTGLVTVSGVAANTSSTATITTTRTGYVGGSATVTATSLAAASTPAFGSTTRTTDGFTVQISNHDTNYTWAGTATASGTVVVSGTGLVTVSGVAANTSSTATITTTRTGYVGGSATVTATSLAAASTPAFGSTTRTTDGFTVQISNHDTNYTWAGTATASGTVVVSGTGLVTVSGVAANTSSTATITTTRTGYVGGSATVTATSLAAASTPAFGSTTRTTDGFTVQISNHDTNYTWAGTATASGTVVVSGTGLVTVSGVAANTSSTATITTTRTGYVGGSATVTATSLAAPGVPTSVSATSGNAQASVSFTTPGDNGGATITSYTVTATPVGGGSAVTATGSSSPITVTGLINGTAYTFTVTATNSVGTGSASSASSAVTPAAAPVAPGAPTSVSGVAGNAQATVTFTAPGDNGGAAITGYTVTSNPAGGTDSNAGSTSLSHVITGLTNGTAYTFTVTATNSVGTSSASSASSSVTPAAAPVAPGAPTSVSGVAGNAQATVTFTAPGNNGGAAITGYTVTSSPAGGTDSNAGSTSLSHVITGLTNGTAYTFTVTATNSVGTSSASSASSSVTPAAAPVAPGAPTSVSGVAGNAQATVTFTAPGNNGGAAITGYTVTSSPAGGTDSNAGSTSLSHVITGLTNGTAYTFTVTATNSVGTSSASSASSSVTPAAAPVAPGAPTAVSGVAGNAQATVTFTAPGNNGGAAITGYTVTSSPAGGTDSNAGSTSLSHVITGLTNGTAYTFTVTATNSVGTSSASSASSSVTPAAAPVAPGAPTAVSGVAGNAQATVTFTAPVSNGGAAITGYTVTSNPAGGTDSNAGSTSLSHVITGLTNGTAYTFTVTATNSVGTSSASSASSSVTPAAAPVAAGAPTAVSGVAGNAQATVTFTAPGDNGGAAITGYTVTSNPAGGTDSNAGSTSLSHVITGLTNGTAYTFTVTATNSVGTSSASSASSSVTPAAAPVAPGAPTAVSGVAGNAQATVTFTAPGNNGGAAITGYTVTSSPAGGTDSNAGSTSLSHVITGLTNGTAYTFTVTATNSVGTSSASSASFSVTPLVTVAVTTQPINLTVAQGYPASFTVAASGTVPLTYQWSKNGVAISGATSTTYTIATVATTDAGSYSVTITNAAGSVTSSAATLTVQAFNVLTANQNVIDGKSTAFMTGVSLGSTQWQISTDAGVTWTNLTNNSTYDGVTTNVLEILKVTTAMSKNRYRYQVTINNQTTTSAAGLITVGTAFLLLPVGVQVDASGILYVSDAAGQTVRKISSDFKISTLAGNALSQGSADGVAGNAKLNEPTGLVLNADNSLTLADTSNAALRQISTIGTVTTFAGTSGSKGSTDATGTAARFSAPIGLTRDGSGHYYVADQTNHTIRKISASGVVTTLAGTAGQSGSVDGSGVAARFNLPTGITCNAQGDLYVSDLGSHLIRKITTAGVVTTLAGQAGASGSTDGSGTVARFFKPSGLAIDSAGNVYVADMGNSTLRKISASGVVSTLAGLPTIDGLMDGTGSNAWFAEPQGLTLDSAGNIYVADTANAVLRKVTPEGLVTTLALAGTAPLISSQPVSITISSGGTATFSVLAIGDAPLSYQWKKDGTDLSGAVTTSYSVAPATTFYAGNYTVAVTNAYGTTLSNTATLTVNGSPPASPNTSTRSGGGGAVSAWFIGALGLLLLARSANTGNKRS